MGKFKNRIYKLSGFLALIASAFGGLNAGAKSSSQSEGTNAVVNKKRQANSAAELSGQVIRNLSSTRFQKKNGDLCDHSFDKA